MIMKANKQIGFIYKNNESIDKILKDGEVVFERGFLREKTSTTLPINFGGVGKDLKDYRVYGNTYQNSTTGKNLRYIEDETAAGVSLTYDNKSGKISIKGTATRTDGIKLSDGGEVNIPAGTYTLSVSEPLPVLINSVVSLSSSTNVAFRIPAGNTSVTVNVPSNGVLAGLYFAVTNGTTYNFDFYLQLEEGSVATEFEPFTNGASPNPDYPQEIVSCGDKTKNLFIVPQTIPNAQRNLATYTKINDNSFSLNYIQNDSTNKAPYVRIDFDITQFKPNTRYTISKKYTVLGDNFSNVGAIRSYINGTNGSVVNSNSFSFTTPSEISSLGVYFYLGYENRTAGESQITFYDIQVEENSSATPYEPYGYKIPVNVNNVITNIYLDEPLRKIDGYSDYIDFINGKIVRNIKEIVLDGSEDWYTSSGTSQVAFNKGVGYIHDTTKLPCNISINCQMPNNNLYFYSTGYSLAAWKTFLSTTNAIVYGRLSTPTEESITLPNIPTVDGNDTLNIETEITPSQVYIKYKSNT